MSGFRRHLFAKLASIGKYIEGYCNVYNNTFTFYLNFTNSMGNYTQIDVTTDSNGFWRYELQSDQSVRFMVSSFSRHSQTESNKLVSVKFSKKFTESVTSWQNAFGNGTGATYACTNLEKIEGIAGNISGLGFAFPFMGCSKLEQIDVSNIDTSGATSFSSTFRNCSNLKKIVGLNELYTNNITTFNSMFYGCFSLESDTNSPFDLSSWNVSALTDIGNLFRSTSAQQNDWYNEKGWYPYSKLKDVRMFDILDGCNISNSFNGFFGGQDNFDIGSIGIVSGTLNFSYSTLNLQSAINILSALSDLQGGTAVITFATSTKNLISADSTAMALVAQAQVYGWTITGF